MTPIHRLHHCAYRCADAETTRAFYQDFLGLPLARAVEIRGVQGPDRFHVLHLYFRLGDRSLLGFFETRGHILAAQPLAEATLRIAFDVDADALPALRARAAAAGIETEAIGDEGRLHVLVLRDPNGYAVELCARCSLDTMDPEIDDARRVLVRWQWEKQASNALEREAR